MDNSGVQRYSDQFIRLALRLGWNLDGELAIYHYKAGLPRWLAEQLTTAEVARGGSLSVHILAKMTLQLEAVKKQQTDDQNQNPRFGNDRKPFQQPGGTDREEFKTNTRCYRCERVGHKAFQCTVDMSKGKIPVKPAEPTNRSTNNPN